MPRTQCRGAHRRCPAAAPVRTAHRVDAHRMDGGAHGWTRCAPGGCAPPHRAVRPVAGAREAVGLLRLHGISTGFVTEQPGVARGVLTDAEGPLSTGGSTPCSARSTCGGCARTPPPTAATAGHPNRD